jgi:hypothetical protein
MTYVQFHTIRLVRIPVTTKEKKRKEKKRKEKTCVRETHVGQDEKSKIKRTLWLPTPQTAP